MRLRQTLLVTGIALLFAVSSNTHVNAQAGKKETVRFESRDGVKLYGHYYRGAGRSSPCVLFVHELAKSSRVGPWKDLADSLNKKSLAVLSFDLRGHGYSTTVEETEFWLPRYHNRNLVRMGDPEEIEYRDFDARYQQYLANDLAAAKAFLERRSDLGECNASNMVVIAAGTGAAVAAPWINAEWHRYELVPPAFPGMRAQTNPTSEGENFLGAVFVSPESKLGGRNLNLASTLDMAGRRGKMPFAILYGEKNGGDRRVAITLANKLQTGRELAFTGALPVPGSGTLSGADLLNPRFGMDRKIAEWIETLKEERGREWVKRDSRETLFVWKAPHNFNVWIPAKQIGDRELLVDSFERFVR